MIAKLELRGFYALPCSKCSRGCCLTDQQQSCAFARDRVVTFSVAQVVQIHERLAPGGILVFVTGQREVEHLCKRLRSKYAKSADAPDAVTSPNGERDICSPLTIHSLCPISRGSRWTLPCLCEISLPDECCKIRALSKLSMRWPACRDCSEDR